jgi:hypothetical protein
MIVLCTYSLQASRTVDMLDVARAHQCFHRATERQLGISGNSELKQAKQEIRRLNGALDVLSSLDRKPRIVDNRQRTDCRACNK